MLVAVAGAAGKTGLAVTSALAARGVRVRAAVRRADQEPAVRAAGAAEVVTVDLHDAASLAAAWHGADGVYHLAPNMDAGEVAAAEASLAAAREGGAQRFVFHSVLQPYAPTMPHHVRKAEAEHLVRTSGLEWTVLQPAAYAQNLLPAVDEAARTGVLAVPYSVRAPFTFVDLADVAAAAARVLTEPGHAHATYELGAPGTVTVEDLAATVAAALGRPVAARRVDPATWRATAGTALAPDVADALTAMFAHYDAYGLTGGSRVLGWLLGRPPTTAPDLLGRHAARLRERSQ